MQCDLCTAGHYSPGTALSRIGSIPAMASCVSLLPTQCVPRGQVWLPKFWSKHCQQVSVPAVRDHPQLLAHNVNCPSFRGESSAFLACPTLFLSKVLVIPTLWRCKKVRGCFWSTFGPSSLFTSGCPRSMWPTGPKIALHFPCQYRGLLSHLSRAQ